MKIFGLALLSIITLAETNCKNRKSSATPLANCYKGKLEVKAACMNYTVSIVEGEVDTSRVLASWTDETTGKIYKNAFGLGSPCSFPTSINQGDEFYFMIDSSEVQNCAVCMMYYPVPSKKLSIRVINDPCTK